MRQATLIAAAIFASACADPSANEAVLTGSVSRVYATPGVWYPGEITVAGTAVGDVRAYVRNGMPITIRRARGPVESGDFGSLIVGDSVVLWYRLDGAILRSLPPVYPVLRIDIHR
jgi:hypothetical protein